MLAVLVLSMAVPSAAVGACIASRARSSGFTVDVRGIALQTVIIMVVLLAVAGGVAAVLLNRGGEAVTDIERQQISREASEFSGSALCAAAGYVWSSATSSCHATPAPTPPDVATLTTKTLCEQAATNFPGEGYTWTPDATVTDPETDGTCST